MGYYSRFTLFLARLLFFSDARQDATQTMFAKAFGEFARTLIGFDKTLVEFAKTLIEFVERLASSLRLLANPVKIMPSGREKHYTRAVGRAYVHTGHPACIARQDA